MTPEYRTGRVRIIAGAWRRRHIGLPDIPGLRPSPDRVRETLFNWLAPVIEGAVCLDLFAGSGILAFEALSRGAARVVMVEQHPVIAAHLGAQLRALAVAPPRGELVHRDALAYLGGTPEAFDIAFVDPPFASGLLPAACRGLDGDGWLRPGALVYLEAPWSDGVPPLPPRWQLLHRQRAGHVGFALAQVARPAS